VKWMDNLSKFCVMTTLNDKYRIQNILGSGGYGKVYLLEETSGKSKWAGKFIKIDPQKNKEKQHAMIVNEIKALRRVNHPNIVKLHEVYEHGEEICLVMEYVAGERLFDVILKNRGLSEFETAIITKQLFSVLSHLQYKDLIHRDFKPENILFTRKDQEGMRIKIIDFGLATLHSKRDGVKKGGTAGYVAPEVLNNQPYDFKADLYSVGVVLYTCITGRPLFSALNYQDLLEKNRKGVIKYSGTSWSKISGKARDMLHRILEVNPTKRYNLGQAIEHPWLAAELSSQERIELLESTLRFVQMDIPKEKGISEIPGSIGQIQSTDNNQKIVVSCPNFELTSQHTMSSISAMSSYYAGQSRESNINTFYKLLSKDSTISERSNPEQETISNDQKSNILSLPPKKLVNGNQKSSQSLTSLNKEVESFRYGGYNIQIHGIGSFGDLDTIPPEEEDPNCSEKYAQLTPNPLRFRSKRNIAENILDRAQLPRKSRSPKRMSFTVLDHNYDYSTLKRLPIPIIRKNF